MIGLAIATCKALLVALFFMHLLTSPRLTWLTVAAGLFWLGILLVLTLRFRHPPVMNRWEYLDGSRRLLAVVAVAIFALCFTLVPLITPQ